MAMNDTPSRRTILKAGSIGVFASAFLAACADDDPVGLSGTPAPATSVPPTVPPREPTQAERDEVEIQLRTLASVELVLAGVYDAHAGDITDPALAPLVGRLAGEHRAAAAALVALTESKEPVEANEHIQTTLVDPIESSLVSADNVRVLMRNLESSLTATYINAVPEMLEASMRQTLMTHGGAAARRVTALSDGVVPRGALFPSTDLISNNAFLRPEAADAAEGEGEGEGEEAEAE